MEGGESMTIKDKLLLMKQIDQRNMESIRKFLNDAAKP